MAAIVHGLRSPYCNHTQPDWPTSAVQAKARETCAAPVDSDAQKSLRGSQSVGMRASLVRRAPTFRLLPEAELASWGNWGYRRIGGTEGKSAFTRLFTQPGPRALGNRKIANAVLLMPTAMLSTHTHVMEERAHGHTSSYQAIVHLRDDFGDRAGND